MSKTIPALLSAATIGGNIQSLKAALSPEGTTMQMLADTAVQCLLHAQAHGDVTLSQRLFEAVSINVNGRNKGPVRAEAMKSWFFEMSGRQMTATKGIWGLKKAWTKEAFKIQEAVNSPFWEWAKPEEGQGFSADSALKIIKGLIGRVDKAVEHDKFTGNPVATKAMLSDILSFAEARATKLKAATEVPAVEETAKAAVA